MGNYIAPYIFDDKKTVLSEKYSCGPHGVGKNIWFTDHAGNPIIVVKIILLVILPFLNVAIICCQVIQKTGVWGKLKEMF